MCATATGFLLLAIGVAMAAPIAAAPIVAAPPPAGDVLAGMDRSVQPGVDFNEYANGGWLKSTEIPADLSSTGVGRELTERTDRRLEELIRHAAESDAPEGSPERKVADYYASFMDEAGIEAKGLTVLKPTFDRIAAIADRAGLARYLGSTLRTDVDVLNATRFYTDNVLGLWVAQDLDDPSRYAPFLLQGGLGMPDRDYYLIDSPQMADIRSRYRSHIAAVLKLAGVANAERKADVVYALELRMAKTHSNRAEGADVKRGDNHWSRAQLQSNAPGLEWNAYLAAAGLQQQQQFIAWQPAALTGLAALVASEPLANWKAYLQFHALEHSARFLTRAVVDEQFAFYGKVLQGTPQLRERWKRAVSYTSSALAEPVGQLYVAAYFPPANKAAIEAMVRNLQSAFATRIDALEWMAPATKAQAKAKLAALKVGIGYPDHWHDYSGLKVVRGDAFGNDERAQMFDYRRNLGKLDAPVDRSEWCMPPQLVNAVNLPAMNALNFPAAILQPPYFDATRPAAMNYGAIGAIIGHEISHSFDDQGALFDAAGRLHNWWTPEDYAHFRASAEQLVAQFNAYRPFPDLAVNGKQTLSENIADLAGLSAAYSAYRLSAGDSAGPLVDGFTPDQQFFLSYAQSRRAKYREPLLRQIIVTDGHSPDQYRASTVRNLDAWYSAFSVKPGDALYLAPGDRVRMW
ncbi:MAG: M13 family metallopeptidase [Steroidobacterales bacterium]